MSSQMLASNVDVVQLDSLVVLKIVKHSETERQSGSVARGYLTGLIAEKTLEVTNCFPYAKQLQQADEEEEFSKQQEEMQDMLRRFRQMNIDYQLLGFYESAAFGACFTEHMVESLFDYQSLVEDSVVIVYDPVKSAQGLLTLKAYRLSLAAMDRCYNDFSPESVKAQGLTYENLMEELPIVIKNSHLVNVMLSELRLQKLPKAKEAFLDLGTGGSLESCVKQLMGHIDTLNQEVNRYNKYMANKQKQDQLQESLVQKRRLENEARRARGEPPLPMDDIRKSIKPQVPPTMLDGMLAAAEVNAHVDHTLKSAGQHLGKLFVAESIVEERPAKERSTSSVNLGDK